MESITPAFSNYWKNRIKEKQRNNKEGWEKKIPDGHYISDLFEQEFASQQQRAQGAFASFQDMDTNKNQQKTTDITKPKQPCICGLLHRWEDYYVLNQQKAPKDWKPNTTILNKIQSKFSSDQRFKDIVIKVLQAKGITINPIVL